MLDQALVNRFVNRFVNGDYSVAEHIVEYEHNGSYLVGQKGTRQLIMAGVSETVRGWFLGKDESPYPVGYTIRSEPMVEGPWDYLLTTIEFHGVGPLKPGSLYTGQWFYRDDMLGSRANHIIIRDGITSIEGPAFAGMGNLLSVQIPGTVSRINLEAFRSCIRIERVIFEGTIERWIKATEGYENLFKDPSMTYPRVVCYDGSLVYSYQGGFRIEREGD